MFENMRRVINNRKSMKDRHNICQKIRKKKNNNLQIFAQKTKD